MRKLLLIPLALFVAYFAWPATAAWQLRSAVKARDIPAIEAQVDWKTLRANIKQTVGGSLKEASENPERGIFTKALLRALAPVAADAVIDLAVTPQTLSSVLAGRSLLGEVGLLKSRDATPAAPVDANDETANDPLSPRRLRWAFFESPTRFRLESVDPRMPGKRVVSILALQGTSWKLVDVYYVTTA